jgi:uncharacterized metal-binding protein YceD (DUF177 family)
MADFEFSRTVKVDSIPPSGLSKRIEATESEREKLAKRFDIVSVESLSAEITLESGNANTRIYVSGTLSADITQECSVSAEDVKNHIQDNFEAWFVDHKGVTSLQKIRDEKDRLDDADEHEMRDESEDPEEVKNGQIDIGEVTAQYLALAIDPYPRAPHIETGDYIEVKDPQKNNPFAKLAALKDKK